MKLYVFTDENDEIIEQVRAENHDQAVAMAQIAKSDTSFYSTDAA